MDNENTENETPTNEGEEETPEQTSEEEEGTPETPSQEEIDELRKKAELAENYKIRAEKAEKKIKEKPKEEEKKPETETMSQKDFLALNEHKVTSDDIDEVNRVAKALDQPVHEALKDPVLQGILSTRAEQRKTAETTQTKTNQRVAQKTNPETVLSKASQGHLPNEDDDAGIEALAEARMEEKRQRAAQDRKMRGI